MKGDMEEKEYEVCMSYERGSRVLKLVELKVSTHKTACRLKTGGGWADKREERA